MIVLGHDPSLASYGLALVDTTKPELLASAVVRTSPSMERAARLRILFDEIRSRTMRWSEKWDIEKVAFEAALSYGGKSLERGLTAVFAVCEARGVGYVTASHLEVVTLTPGTVRKAVVGNGSVPKDVAVAAVRRLLVKDELAADAADAAAVALAAGGFVVAPFSRAKRSKDDRTAPLPLIHPQPKEQPLSF